MKKFLNSRFALYGSALLVIISGLIVINSSINYLFTVEKIQKFTQDQKAQVGGSVADGLIAHYSFDEGSGTTLNDSSGNGKNGILVNGPQWVNGIRGGALSFDGIDDYVSLYNLGLGQKSTYGGDVGIISLSFWMKPTKTEGINFDTVIKSFAGFDLMRIEQNSGLWSIFYNSELKKNEWHYSSKIEPLNWTHVVMVLEGGKGFKIYLDGKLDKEVLNDKYFLIDRGDKTSLAERYTTNTNYFKGLLDDLRIYNKALSQDDIKILYGKLFTIVTPTEKKIKVGDSLDYTFSVDNPTGIPISYSSSKLPTGASLDASTGKITWVPVAGQGGIYYIEVLASGGGSSDTNSLKVSVAEIISISSCKNEGDGRCIDFGNGENLGGNTFVASSLSEPKEENSIGYREILGGKVLDITLESFDVDGSGLPNSDLLLEIKFKDTINDGTNDASKRGSTKRAKIESYIDLKNSDTLHQLKYVIIGSLGNYGDNQWRTAQIPLYKTPFQLIKSINGRFSLKITMPTIDGSGSIALPVDYISLKKISKGEAEAFYEKMLQDEHYTRIQPPSDLGDYNSSGSVLFVRDYMRPIWQNSRPYQNEVNANLNISSASGLTEALSVGVYSSNGSSIDNFQISNLISGNGNTIYTNSAEYFSVKFRDARLNDYYSIANNKTVMLMPNYLEPFRSQYIPAGNSLRLVAKIYIPVNTPAGTYEGLVKINTQGNVLTKKISFEVLPIQLEELPFFSFIADPFLKAWTPGNQNQAVKLFNEVGFKSFSSSQATQIIVKGTDKTNAFVDLNSFESMVSRLKNNGLLGDKVYVEARIPAYSLFFGKNPEGDPDLWSNLSNQEYLTFLDRFYRDFIDVYKRNGVKEVFFQAQDEPGIDQYKRILSDRIFTFLKSRGYKTATTYQTVLDCDSQISSSLYRTPGNVIPPLTNLVDYKIFALTNHTAENINKHPNHSYYTTAVSYLRNPVYNRFVNGWFAIKDDVDIVYNYNFGDWYGDPWDDFTPSWDRNELFPWMTADFVMAYPTWNDGLYPTMNFEGIREGHKDARYVATLERLIFSNTDLAISKEAKLYLENIKSKIKPFFWGDYVNSKNGMGFYPKILSDLSETRSSNDYEAFSKIRFKIIDYIKQILNKGGVSITTPIIPIVDPTPTPILRATDGLCGNTLNSCTQGILRNTEDSTTQYLWMCLGSNNGFDASCSQTRYIPPVTTNPPTNPPTNSIVQTRTPSTYKPQPTIYKTGTTPNKDIYTLTIPTSTIDITLPKLPSWLDIIKSLFNKIITNVIRGVKRTGEVVGI